MSNEKSVNRKDALKSKLYSFLKKRVGKLQTPMQQVFLQLENRGELPKEINALEMFGMHGLWHTMDYIEYVESLDFFEINTKYLELSKKNLSKYNVTFYGEDSIKYISETTKKYNLVISDSPFGGDFYSESGLAYFFDDLIRVCDKKGIIIFNIKSKFFINLDEIEAKAKNTHQNIGLATKKWTIS